MLGTVTGMFDNVVAVLSTALGLGCGWLGLRAVFRPRRRPAPIRGPVWVVRAWGLGYLLLGIFLTVEPLTRMLGGEPGPPSDVIRWVAGPLVVGSILAAFLSRRRGRRRDRAGHG